MLPVRVFEKHFSTSGLSSNHALIENTSHLKYITRQYVDEEMFLCFIRIYRHLAPIDAHRKQCSCLSCLFLLFKTKVEQADLSIINLPASEALIKNYFILDSATCSSDTDPE